MWLQEKISSDIGLFARLNNQGLLPEIERKQFQNSTNPELIKNLINQLNKITRRTKFNKNRNQRMD